MPLTPFTSQKFRFYAFISMVLLVFVHGYDLNERYLQPWSVVNERMTFNSFFQYLTANGLFRFRIPILFIISGYLFSLQDHKPYKERMNKRVRTLLLPYLLWSAFGLLLTYVFELFPFTKAAVLSTHLMQIDETKMLLHDYTWYEWLGRWILVPVPFQLWFIRVLLIYNLAYPAIKWCVLKVPYVFLPLATYLWLETFGIGLIEGEGLLFFSLGVWMQQRAFNIETPNKWLRPVIWLPVFIVASVIKTRLAFVGHAWMGDQVFTVLTLLHKLVVLSGMIGIWFGADAVVRWCMQRPWFIWLSSFSFIIYALHVPLLTYGIDMVFSFVHTWPHYRLLTYLFLPLCIIGICVAVGALLRRSLPKVYALLTGGRGI